MFSPIFCFASRPNRRFSREPRHRMPPLAWQSQGCATVRPAPCSLVTAKSSRSCYTVGRPRNLHGYYGSGYLHFITTSCYPRRPLLGTPQSRHLFLEVMEQTGKRHHFVVVGYVVMPEHVHLLFREPERGKPSLVLAALNKPSPDVSRKIFTAGERA